MSWAAVTQNPSGRRSHGRPPSCAGGSTRRCTAARRGGGKSDALLMEALRQVRIPHYRGLILRKTFPQLSELIDRSRELYPAAFPKARYHTSEHYWHFPGGAKIHFGSMQHPDDRVHYQGKRFDYIAVDELTHFTLDEYTYLFSRNRPGGPGTRVYMRAATNPGGIGHGWVKDRFLTPAPPMTTIRTPVEYFDEDGNLVKAVRSRIFVPARVTDNKALIKNDPNYLASLSLLPHAVKEALLNGSWDTFSGQVFTEWRNDPVMYTSRKNTHVIAPFDIPSHWRVYRGLDWGFSKPFAVGWFAVDEQRRVYHIREYYGFTGTPDVGLKMEPSQVAAKIREIEQNDPQLKGKLIRGVADPAIFQRQTGQSTADLMEKEHVYFTPGDHSRIAGKMQLHYRLRMDEQGFPQFYVFSTCLNFIRTVPALVYDQRDPEDIDTRGEDHIYDMTRYVLMENPVTAPIAPTHAARGPDPLGLRIR